MKRFFTLITLLVLVLLALAAPAAAQDPQTTIPILVPEVIAVYDHDPGAFTQGLLLHNGLLYESTGEHGASTLREVDPETGDVLRSVDIPEEYFAEGLALVDNRLIQLTWQSGVAFVYDLDTFEQIDTFTYEGEGWGLCANGDILFMSDGSPVITAHEADSFDLILGAIVTYQNSLVSKINELECVGDSIYANIWKENVIVQIDRATGRVVALIDASDLLTPEEAEALEEGREVLNGIAYNPDTDTFLLTGKHWPKLFEVRFVEPE
ncbi:MAG: glutaminyl-peptide cyclotransferase [Anaerolineae bacterium]|nr:glutaminyl-peptide cyclotransferase [Anaerolineae bacterium]